MNRGRGIGQLIFTVVVAALALGMMTRSAKAQLIAYEGFDYTPPGNALDTYAGGGTGWLGNWTRDIGTWTVASSTMSYTTSDGSLVVSGGKVTSSLAQSRRLYNLPGGRLGNTPGTLWVSMLAQQTAGSTNNNFGGFRLPTGPGTFLYFGKPFNSATWGIDGGPGTTIRNSTVPTSQAAFLVLRIDFRAGADDVYMWVNPSLTSEPSIATAAVAAPAYNNFEDIDLAFLEAGSNNSPLTFEADEIRLGYQYGDVAPSTVSQWAQIADTGPSGRARFGMARDTERSRVVLFGGTGATLLGDTWEYDGAGWTQRMVSGPEPRDAAAMAYDALHQQCVLFGGTTNTGTIYGDTWLWSGEAWARANVANPPSPRYYTAMAYDAARARVVMFGGNTTQNAGSELNETWVWDGMGWALASQSGPSARNGTAMAYDERRQRVVLFGGARPGTTFGDTWEWDGMAWTQVSSTGPVARRGHAMAYNTASGTTVLYGGRDAGNASLTDTWEWNGIVWRQSISASNPGARFLPSMSSNFDGNGVALFGGLSAPSTTWAFGQAPTLLAASGNAAYASRCSMSACLTINVRPASPPVSSGIQVRVNLQSIGGSATQLFADNGTGCDAAAGDNIYSFSVPISTSLAVGTYNLPFVVTDAQGRSVLGILSLSVTSRAPGERCDCCGPMDVAFVMDVTGSMSGANAGVRSGVTSLIDTIVCASGGDYRLGLVRFGDTVLGVLPFANANSAAFIAALNNPNPSDGGDGTVEEASDAALHTAINTLTAPGNGCQIGNFSVPWRSGAQKVIVVITDNPPSNCNGNSAPPPIAATTLANAAASAGIRIVSVYVKTGSYNSSVASTMQTYSNRTGGCYVETDSAGTGIAGSISGCIATCGRGEMDCLTVGALTYAGDETGAACACNPRTVFAHDLQILAGSGDVVKTRYSSVSGIDVAVGAGNANANYTTNTHYALATQVRAGLGEEWCLIVKTRRKGELTSHNDGVFSGCGSAEQTIYSVQGSIAPSTTCQIISGSLNLPSHTNSSSSGADLAFDDSASAVISGVGPQTVTLDFHWDQTVTSRRSGILCTNGDDSGIRLGQSDGGCGSCLFSSIKASQYASCSGCNDNGRTMADDGHFVTITCVRCVKPFCADFNVESPDLTSAVAVENFTTEGAASPPLYNPGATGAGGGAGGGSPTSPDGFLRLEDALPGQESLFLIAPSAFLGRWDCFCGNLEFDFRMSPDGVPGSPPCNPTVQIIRDDGSGSAMSATFVSAQAVNENMGWVHIVVPIPPLHAPSALGTWTLSSGATWEMLLKNITKVRFRGDCTNGFNDLDYDNICLSPANDCLEPPAGLVGWWPFDEKVAPLHDAASQRATFPWPTTNALGSPPTCANSPKAVKGVIMGAMEFDGVDDMVFVPASAGNAGLFSMGSNDFTIDAWIRTTQLGLQTIVDRRDTSFAASPSGYRFFLNNGYVALGISDPTDPGETIFQSSNASAPMLADGAWHFVAATIDRQSAGRPVKLYADGAVVGQFSSSGKTGLLLTGNSADLRIGRSHAIGGPAQSLLGALDEVEIFRRALSAAEINAIYRARCGKCRERCALQLYSPIISFPPVNNVIRSRVCNGSSEDKTYSWSLANTTGPGCTIGGLTFTPAGGTVTIPAFSCVSVNSTIGLPPGMTTSDLACYVFTFLGDDGEQHSCTAKVAKCDVIFCNIDRYAGRIQPVAFPTIGVATPIYFDFHNMSNASRTVPYRVQPVAMDGSPSRAVSVNGLPPGTLAQGMFTVPADSFGTLDVGVAFGAFESLGVTDVVLSLDLDGDGVFTPHASVGVEATWREHSCPGDLVDDFESYALGDVCRPNAWEAWAGSVDVCAVVTSDQSLDGGRSLYVAGTPGGSTGRGDNTVRRIAGVGGGRWTFRASTFVPQGATGKGLVGLLSIYDEPRGAPPSSYRWGLRVGIDADTDMVLADPNAGSIPLLRDQWVEIRAEIDLDADTVDYFYNDVLFVQGRSWRQALEPGGLPRIQAINVYGGEPGSGGITGFYVDGVSIRGSCLAPDCNHNGIDDTVEFLEHLVSDANRNGIPDECECVADFDDGSGTGTPDGGVTIDDLLYYLGLYAAGNVRADVDDGSGSNTPDGGVTIDDLLYYFQRYTAGC